MAMTLGPRRRRAGAAILAAAMGSTLVWASPAAASGPVADFGTGGVANHHSDPTVAEGYNGVVAAPGGGTYQAGFTTIPGTTDRAVLVTKAGPDGALDTSFSSNTTPTGRSVINIVPQADFAPGVTGGLELAKGIAVDHLGRLLVLGEVEAPQTGPNPTDVDLFVLRLHANGRLDTSFGVNGVNRVSLSDGAGTSTRDFATWRIFVRPDKKIVFGASQGLDSADPGRDNRDVAVVQLKANGGLDTTFGDGGIAINRKSGNENVRGALLDDQGRIVVTAYHNAGAGNQPFLYRFNADGSADATFGDDGIATGNPGGLSGLAEAYGITESGGGYVVSAYGRAGWAPATHAVDALLFRFTGDGGADSGWGTTLGQSGMTSYFTDPAVTVNAADRHRTHLNLPDGRILGVGHLNDDGLVTVTSADGTPDVTFGNGGALAIDLGASGSAAIDQFWAVTPVGDGYTFVAAGTSGATATSAPVLAKIEVDPVTPAGPSFPDVPESSPFFDTIEWAAAEGITSGYSDGTFRPVAPINRDAVAAMLFRAANPGAAKPTCAPGEQPFTDVPSSHQFCGEIAWLKAEGITTGNTDGSYTPAAQVSRQAVAAFLARAWATGPLPACDASLFTDVTASNPFCKEITWMKQQGISNGWQVGSTFQFRPGISIERQAFVTFLYRQYTD